MKRHNPQTPEEWQLAVDAAAGLRVIEDCRMYGLIEGGPKIDAERCDEIITLGALRGVTPSAPAVDLAIALVREFNNLEAT